MSEEVMTIGELKAEIRAEIKELESVLKRIDAMVIKYNLEGDKPK